MLRRGVPLDLVHTIRVNLLAAARHGDDSLLAMTGGVGLRTDEDNELEVAEESEGGGLCKVIYVSVRVSQDTEDNMIERSDRGCLLPVGNSGQVKAARAVLP
jgi:hypothetical protein